MSKNNIKQKDLIVFAIYLGLLCSLIAVILSALLVCKHSGVCVSSLGCTIDGVDGCHQLGNSEHSKIAIPFLGIGIPIAWFGFSYYAILFSLFLRLLLKPKNPALGLIAGIIVFGLIYDLYLAYLNFFILLTPCLLCLYTYLCQLIIFFVTIWLYFSPNYKTMVQNSSLTSIWDDIKASRLAIGGAIGAVLLYILIISLSASNNHNEHKNHSNNDDSSASEVLPIKKTASILRELRVLKKANLSTKGLKSYIGKKDAYVEVHEFIDFRCPHCRVGSNFLKKMAKRWPGRLKIYVRYFPLDSACNPLLKGESRGKQSCKGAWAAYCSATKPYYNLFVSQLFDFQTSRTPINELSLKTLTESLDGNWNEKKACMNSADANRAVQRDIRDAKKIKVSATPTIVIADRILPAGIPDKKWFIRTLDALVLEKEGPSAIREYKGRK